MAERFATSACVDTGDAVGNSLRSGEPHVAQKSRRDKLRGHTTAAPDIHLRRHDHPPTHLDDMPSNVDLDEEQQPGMFSSDQVLNLSSGQQPNPSLRTDYFMPPPVSEVGQSRQNFSSWKRLLSSSPSSDWTVNCDNDGPTGGSNCSNHGFVEGHMSSSCLNLNDFSSTPTFSTSHRGQKQFGEMHPFGSSSNHQLYQNALHVVSSSSGKSPQSDVNDNELASLVSPQTNIPSPWLIDGCHSNELALLPSTNISPSRIANGAVSWLPTDQPKQWSSSSSHELDCSKTTQSRLSLTLSSNPTHPLPTNVSICTSYSNPSGGGRNLLVQQGDVGSSSDVLRGVGPIGPFTGYATILKGSKFLKPAQQLLDECCGAVTGSLSMNQLPSLGNTKSPNDDGNNIGASHVYSSSLHSSCSTTAYHPQLQEKKAKLLLMHSEVSRSYKHYNQQIQMAISSFKSVGGLSAAMPFLAVSVKTITKHFRFLRGVISDQLLSVSKNLGEEELTSLPQSVDQAESSGMKFLNQTLLRQNAEYGASGLGLMKNHNQPVWKPQRGLPERAVAVLRAWLFDHFLHPYPTDTDKLMLVTQTGLSRNQVSNWFINARVRVWKPMVEEVHMLDTKGLAAVYLNSSSTNDGQHQHRGEDRSGVLEGGGGAGIAGDMECMQHQQWVVRDHKRAKVHMLDTEGLAAVDLNSSSTNNGQHQHRGEDRSGVLEGGGGAGIAGDMECMQHQQWVVPDHKRARIGVEGGGFDIGELGRVSLTLGLRQEEEVSHREQQMRAYFGSQLIREYVG